MLCQQQPSSPTGAAKPAACRLSTQRPILNTTLKASKKLWRPLLPGCQRPYRISPHNGDKTSE